jgi:MerR family transcriptional regulator/heat shock protein HspR
MAPQDDESGEELADEPVYVISVAAKLAELPSWTLRVLDKEGIVCPKRTSKDRRLYSDRDIDKLARVRYLTEERGVNMNGVKLILEMEDQALAADRATRGLDRKGDNH